jgi:predicted RNase H-like HicB family nuclease
MMHRYPISVFWSEEDRCWIATAPDLKHCSADGDTPAEAVSELEIAIEGVLAVMREHGDPIPPVKSSAA